MNISFDYIAAIISSTFRQCSPLLYCALAAAICAKVNLFNIAMEGKMLSSAFFSIVVNYYTGSLLLSVLAGVAASVSLALLLGFLVIRLKASPVIAGMAINTMMGGATIYLMHVFFGTKGVFTSPNLVGLRKITPFFSRQLPFVADMLSGLTVVDYFSWISALVVFFVLYKMTIGYRLRAIGINLQAARSLGIAVHRYQYLTLVAAGVFCGLAGVLLSMGSVTLFIQNITSGRGYIAMAANNLGRSHPLGVLLSSLFFGATQALGNFLQNTSLKGQITASIPYAATILALIGFSLHKKTLGRKKLGAGAKP